MALERSPTEARVCPRCADPVPAGVACPACQTSHHAECARTFGACAACGGSLGPDAPAVDLPRLPLLARRVAAWSEVEAPGQPEAWVVVLLPSGPEALEGGAAAEAVGQILRAGAYEGRQRLGAPYPEPLVRVATRDAARELNRALEAVGLRTLQVRLAELLRPLSPLRAKTVRLGDEVAYVEADGREASHAVTAPRLVVTAPLVATSESPPRARGVTPTASFSRSTLRLGGGARRRQGAAWVFLPDDVEPVHLREHEIADYTALQDQMTVSSATNFERLTGHLARGGELRALPREVGGDALLGPDGSNEAALELIVRLVELEWRRGRG